MCTVQAPQDEVSQPTWVPVRPSCSRRNCTSSRRGSTSSSTRLPFTVRRMVRPTHPPRARRLRLRDTGAVAPMLHTTRPAFQERSRARRKRAFRLQRMRLRRLLVATALLALSPTSAWASGGVWSPVRVAPAIARGSADLPGSRWKSDGTAVAAWTEDGACALRRALPASLRPAPRDRRQLDAGGAGRGRRPRHARARPPAHPAGHRRHARRLLGGRRIRRRRPSRPPRPRCRSPRPQAALRSDAQRARRLRRRARRPMTISSAARARRRRLVAGRRRPLPRAVTLVQQLQLALLPDGSAVLLFLGQGPAAGDVPRPYAVRALGRGRLGGARRARRRLPSWPAPTSGLAVDAGGSGLRGLERLRRPRAHLDARRSAARSSLRRRTR